MPDSVKFLIVEKNSVELEFHEEKQFTPSEMPFSSPGFIADNVYDAILESPTITGISRFAVICGYDSVSNNNRWMEFHRGNSSDASPFVLAEEAELSSLSVSIEDPEDGSTFSVYKNDIFIEDITISDNPGATDIAYKKLTTPITCMAGDYISVRQTSAPSTKSPVVTLFFKVTEV